MDIHRVNQDEWIGEEKPAEEEHTPQSTYTLSSRSEVFLFYLLTTPHLW